MEKEVRQFKMGSLFDGSGGFPLASVLCGIEPVWASEIEPFPIKVTRARFPNMKHYGDISKISGADLEPVDLITGGSPCQSLSVAGKRDGMSKKCLQCGHLVLATEESDICPECGGVMAYTRSGLFMEQIRIIKEMREADELRQLRMRGTVEHIRPRFMLWENVTGAFSSNKGEDFRAVLEETARIKDKTAVIPRPDKGKWQNAGCIMGDGYSIAWRVLDAQYWGVPQRRRRIALVADFGGQCAGEILFKRNGLSRNFTESRKAWQGITGNLAESIGEAGEPFCYNGENLTSPLNKQKPQPGEHTLGTDPRNYVMIPSCAAYQKEEQYAVDFGRTADRIQMNADKAVTLLGLGGGAGAKTGLYCLPKLPCLDVSNPRSACNYDIAPTLCQRMGTGGNQVPVIPVNKPQQIPPVKNLYCMATQQGGAEIMNDLAPTITAAAGMSGNNQPVINQPIPIQDQEISNGSGNGLGIGKENDPMYTLMADTQHGIAYSLQENMIGREDHNGPQGSGVNEDVSFTLNATDRHAVAYGEGGFGEFVENRFSTLKAAGGVLGGGSETLIAEIINEYIVRRLIPLECSRLQGFPDWWTDGLQNENPTEEELAFWREVFETHREIVTGASKPKTDKQIIKWLKEEPNDGAMYKMWGNGIALPCFWYVIEGIKEVLERTSQKNLEFTTIF